MKAENQVYKDKMRRLNGLGKSNCLDLEKKAGIMGENKIFFRLAAIMFKKKMQTDLNWLL